MARAIARSRASTESSRQRIASPRWQRTPAGPELPVHAKLPELAQRSPVEPGIQRQAHEASEGAPRSAGREQRPDETPAAEAAEIAKQALDAFGYEKLIERAIEVGLVKKGTPDASAAGRPVQRMIDGSAIQRQAGALTAGAIFTRYAVTAGITSQLDSPVPGPADLIALGILVVGLVHAGVVAMSASRARSLRCRCSARPFQNRNPPADCPAHVEGVGMDRGSCQANAKSTAPQHCRAFYGHCYIRS